MKHIAIFGVGTALALWLLPVPGVQAAAEHTLMAKAPVTGCYCGLGDPDNISKPDPGYQAAIGPNGDCAEYQDNPNNDGPYDTHNMCMPKYDESYVWTNVVGGYGDHQKAWWGTIANTPCVAGGQLAETLGFPLPPFEDSVNGYLVRTCESFLHTTPSHPATPPSLGDQIGPRAYYMKLGSNAPATAGPVYEVDLAGTCPSPGADLLRRTAGFRSSGYLKDAGLVMMAGPDVSGVGVNMFAIDAYTGKCVGARSFPQYNDVRGTWALYGDQAYVGVANTGGKGTVLRWRGNANNPFVFEPVGLFFSVPSNLIVHKGNLVAGTWPNLSAVSLPDTSDPKALLGLLFDLEFRIGIAGIYEIPIPNGGLTQAHTGKWHLSFRLDEYDPDPLLARGQGMGGVVSNQKHVCYGTMQIPGTGVGLHVAAYQPDLLGCVLDPGSCSQSQLVRLAEADRNSSRPSSVFCTSQIGEGEDEEGEHGHWSTWDVRELLYYVMSELESRFGPFPEGDDEEEGSMAEALVEEFLPMVQQHLNGAAPLLGRYSLPLRLNGRLRHDLSYGESYLPAWDPIFGSGWNPRSTHHEPRHGGAGVNNPDALYTWSGAYCEGGMFLGMFDSGQTGADLHFLSSGRRRAETINTNGWYNPTNWGNRTLSCVKTPYGEKLLIGTANGTNLSRMPYPQGPGVSGWELHLRDNFPDGGENDD